MGLEDEDEDENGDEGGESYHSAWLACITDWKMRRKEDFMSLWQLYSWRVKPMGGLEFVSVVGVRQIILYFNWRQSAFSQDIFL